MKVTLDLDASTCTVEREDGDLRMKRSGYGGSPESQLLYHVRLALQAQGHDVLKKRMHKDGHLVADTTQYVRERKGDFSIWNSSYAIFDAGEKFNEEGRVVLRVEVNRPL